MTFRTSFQSAHDALQGIAGPDGLDVRTNRVYVVVRTFTSLHGVGTPSEASTELTPRPHVLERKMGRELVVTAVSADLPVSTLNPTLTGLQELRYRVTGPNAGDYALADISVAGPFARTLLLHRIERAQPQPTG